jgi:hypothetical protein
MRIGRWQREIISKLDSGPFWFTDVLPADVTQLEYVAAWHAARRLDELGYIRLVKKGRRLWVTHGHRKLAMPAPKFYYVRVRVA